MGTINAEVSILWGLIFSLYLDINSYNPDPTGIRNAVIMVAVGAFVTRLVAHYFKIPNIKFRADPVETPALSNLDVQDELDEVEEQKNYKQAKESKEFVSKEEAAEKIRKFKDPEEQKEIKEPNEEKFDEGPKEPPKL